MTLLSRTQFQNSWHKCSDWPRSPGSLGSTSWDRVKYTEQCLEMWYGNDWQAKLYTQARYTQHVAVSLCLDPCLPPPTSRKPLTFVTRRLGLVHLLWCTSSQLWEAYQLHTSVSSMWVILHKRHIIWKAPAGFTISLSSVNLWRKETHTANSKEMRKDSLPKTIIPSQWTLGK